LQKDTKLKNNRVDEAILLSDPAGLDVYIGSKLDILN
jgi:hypothetical protein